MLPSVDGGHRQGGGWECKGGFQQGINAIVSQEGYLSRHNQGNQNQISGQGLGEGWGGWVKGGGVSGVEYRVEGEGEGVEPNF